MSAGNGAVFVPDPDWPSIVELASQRWGQPTSRRQDHVRFGVKGSKDVKLSTNVWMDYETGEGGGYIEMWAAVRKCPLPERRTTAKAPPQRAMPKPARKIVAVYPYHRADGSLVLEVVRFAGGGPRFNQRRPDGNGGWIWNLDGIPAGERPLYRLPGLLAPDIDRVWMCEGEKDADRLAALGRTATTNIGGAGKWRKEYAEELFRGKYCVALQDNDEAGRKHAEAVARSLVGIAASTKVLLLPGLPPKGDVSDWLDAGHTIEQLEDLADAAPEYRPTPEARPETKAGRILSGRDFLATFVPPDYVIDGIVQRARLYACTSITGHGKTAVWLYIACMVAASRYVGTIETAPGGVVILAGENSEDLCGRLHAMVHEYRLDPAKLPHVLPANFPLIAEEADTLKAEIDAIAGDKALIVADTGPAYFPGDNDNDNVQMGEYGRVQRTLTACRGRPAVVALTHPIKHADRESLIPRGGGAYLNELDGNLYLWSDAVGESTTLHWQGKLRGADFAPVPFALKPITLDQLKDAKGRPFRSIVAAPQSQEAADNARAQTRSDENAVLYWLKERRGISIRAIAREAGWVSDNEVPNTARVHRCLTSLKGDKLVRLYRGKWVITEAGKLELEPQT